MKKLSEILESEEIEKIIKSYIASKDFDGTITTIWHNGFFFIQARQKREGKIYGFIKGITKVEIANCIYIEPFLKYILDSMIKDIENL